MPGDAARHADPLPQHLREENARDKGQVVLQLPLHEITVDALSRDQMDLDEEDLAELRRSIMDHGLRLPIEVFEPTNPEAAGKYALISGFC